MPTKNFENKDASLFLFLLFLSKHIYLIWIMEIFMNTLEL